MVTAVPACIVSEPTRQAADSGTKTLGWSFRVRETAKPNYRKRFHRRVEDREKKKF